MTMFIKVIALTLVLSLMLSGCNTPVDELAYRGVVPEQYVFNEALIRIYAEELAALIQYSPPEQRGFNDGSAHEFSISGPNKIVISIVACPSSRQIYASVFRGGYQTKEAQRVLNVAQELFAEMFPPARMERHIRMQGFPGV